jgi:hypothetical protein
MITTLQRPQFLAAITAYARWCTRWRVPYSHPNAQVSSVGWKYVHLCNSQRRLARYDRTTGHILSG